VLVEELVDEPFQVPDLAASGAVIIDEGLQPLEPVCASEGGRGGGVYVFEAAEPAFRA
jgi:hypothetical protein